MNLDELERGAQAQRNRVHDTAAELRSKIATARDKFAMDNIFHKYFLGLCIVTGAMALGVGYGITGLFARR
jgi:hypothetical protein